jgi:hypothetical protein
VANKESARVTSNSKTSFFGETFGTVSLLLTGVIVVLLFFVPQITSLKVAEVVSFYTQDGYCVESTTLTKLHCFGDFGYPIELVRSGKDIWNKEVLNAYPVINFQIYLLFSFIASKISYLFALILYLGTLIAAMTIPFWHALRNKPLKERMIFISTSVVATFPFLIVVDRGNNSAWTLPFIYFFIAARYSKIPRKYDVIFATIAIILRPQNLILLVVFLSKREYRKIFTTLFLSTFVNILGLLLWDAGNFVMNLKNQINQLIQYGSGIPGTWPPNLSFARGAKTFTEILNFTIPDSILINIGYLTGVLIVFKLVLVKNKYNDAQILYLTLPLIFLIPVMSWYYYSAILLVIVASTLLLKTEITELGLNSQTRGCLFLFATLLTTIPLCIPIWQGQNNITQVFVPFIWLVTYVTFIVSGWRKA